MEIIDTTKFIDASKFDWGTYCERGESSLKKDLEENPEMWDNWTISDKRYMLVCYPMIIENDIDNNPSGKVTAHLDCHVSSDNLEDLRLLWKSKFIQQRYDTTKQHFIADIKERKVIEFVSVCM